MTFLVLQASGSFPYCYMHYLNLTPARSGIIAVWHSQIWPHLFTPWADFSWYSDGLQWWCCWREHCPLVLFESQIFTFSDVSMWVAVLLLPSHYPFLKVKKKIVGKVGFLHCYFLIVHDMIAFSLFCSLFHTLLRNSHSHSWGAFLNTYKCLRKVKFWEQLWR